MNYSEMNKETNEEKDLRTLTLNDINERVSYHAPSARGIDRHAELSGAVAQAMRVVDVNCPNGREKSLAFTKLEEAKMWASAAVARNKETR